MEKMITKKNCKKITATRTLQRFYDACHICLVVKKNCCLKQTGNCGKACKRLAIKCSKNPEILYIYSRRNVNEIV